MKRSMGLRMGRQGLAGGLLLLFALVFAPSPARACNAHYVILDGKHPLTLTHGQQHRGPVRESPTPTPCQGPYCSEAPNTPLLPLSEVNPPSTDQWGCLLSDLPLHGNQRWSALSEEYPQPRLVRGPSIYHPPRLP